MNSPIKDRIGTQSSMGPVGCETNLTGSLGLFVRDLRIFELLVLNTLVDRKDIKI